MIPGLIAAMPTLGGVLLLLGAAYAWQRYETRRARRETAITRHPSWQARARRTGPGRPVDGEPLSDDELAEFTAIMTRPAQDRAQETSADESAE